MKAGKIVLGIMFAVILFLIGALAVLTLTGKEENTEITASTGQEPASGQETGADLSGEEGEMENLAPEKEENPEEAEPVQEETSEEGAGENQLSGAGAEELLASMTLEEKAAQIFFVTPEAITGVETATVAGDATRQALAAHPVGGIVYFGKNILDPAQTRSMLENTWNYSNEVMKVPVWLGVDEEGGRVARVAGNSQFSVTRYSNMRSIGDTGDPAQAYQVGVTIASYLKELGFNMDFAPDADAITNPENTVIGDRSFGTDPSLVGEMAAQAVQGFQDQGISACIKHFPGHGQTVGDTHEGYAYTQKTMEEMKASDLLPFEKGIEAGTDFVMVSHISAPNAISQDVPASLSSEFITDLLRNEMGYEGIIITDAMNMGAIAEHYGSAQAAVAAFTAGVDMILMPEDFQAAYQGILDAVGNGTISQERLDQSVLRILEKKLEKLGN